MSTNFTGIGPDFDLPKGAVGEMLITRLIPDESGTGFLVTAYKGGVLLLKLTHKGQEARRSANTPWDDARRDGVLLVLTTWGNATGPAYKHGLHHHAKALGVPYSEIKAGCFINPGRTRPPLRVEYERAQARRRDTFNKMKAERRIGGRTCPRK